MNVPLEAVVERGTCWADNRKGISNPKPKSSFFISTCTFFQVNKKVWMEPGHWAIQFHQADKPDFFTPVVQAGVGLFYQLQQSKKKLGMANWERDGKLFQRGPGLKALRNLQEPYHFEVYWHARTLIRVNKLLTDRIFFNKMQRQRLFHNFKSLF